MCGRFVEVASSDELEALFHFRDADDILPGPSYNIAPSQTIRTVTAPLDKAAPDAPPRRRLVAARWGLVPAWVASLSAGPTPFNARIEKVPTSGMYRGPFAKRRAIIPASGFYERRRVGDRQSYYIHPGDDSHLALAGLYDWWRNPDLPEDAPDRWLLSATIITSPANAAMTPIHDRQPLYLHPDLWDDWLDPSTPGDQGLLDEAVAGSGTVAAGLEYRPIGSGWLSTRTGAYRDDPGLIAA